MSDRSDLSPLMPGRKKTEPCSGSVKDTFTDVGDLLAEIWLQQTALLAFEAADGFLLDLTHTLARKIEFGAYLFKCHLLAADAEKHLQDLALAFMELTQCAFNLFG